MSLREQIDGLLTEAAQKRKTDAEKLRQSVEDQEIRGYNSNVEALSELLSDEMILKLVALHTKLPNPGSTAYFVVAKDGEILVAQNVSGTLRRVERNIESDKVALSAALYFSRLVRATSDTIITERISELRKTEGLSIKLTPDAMAGTMGVSIQFH